MDCRVPPRVTYWTGIFEPSKEALSREVDILRRLRGSSLAPVVSFSSGQRSSLFSRDGAVRLSSDRGLLLRMIAAAVEPLGELTHVLGAIDCWHLLRAVGRRPVVLTVAIPGPVLPLAVYERVRLFVAETDVLAGRLVDGGIDPGRVTVIPPGVDLERFAPAPSPQGRFRVLFASTPSSPSHFASRGIPLIVETARLCPDVDFVLLWRQWGSRSEAQCAFEALRPPPNVVIQHGDVPDMVAAYQSAHATIWLAEDGYGKSCPNSVVEGLACGRPAVVSSSCGIADTIVRHGAGVAPSRDPAGVAAAVRQLRERHEVSCGNARDLAVRRFGLESFIEQYVRAYRDVLGGRTVCARPRAAENAARRLETRPRSAASAVPAD